MDFCYWFSNGSAQQSEQCRYEWVPLPLRKKRCISVPIGGSEQCDNLRPRNLPEGTIIGLKLPAKARASQGLLLWSHAAFPAESNGHNLG